MEILVHFFPNLEPISTPMNFLLDVGLAALGAAFAAKFTPSSSVPPGAGEGRPGAGVHGKPWSSDPVAAGPVNLPQDDDWPGSPEPAAPETGPGPYGDLGRLAGGSTRA